MYSDRRGTDKSHPGQNLPDKRPPDKPQIKNPREQLRENLYRGLLSGFFRTRPTKNGGRSKMYIYISSFYFKSLLTDRNKLHKSHNKNIEVIILIIKTRKTGSQLRRHSC